MMDIIRASVRSVQRYQRAQGIIKVFIVPGSLNLKFVYERTLLRELKTIDIRAGSARGEAEARTAEATAIVA